MAKRKSLGQIKYEAEGGTNWHRLVEHCKAAEERAAAAVEREVLRRLKSKKKPKKSYKFVEMVDQ